MLTSGKSIGCKPMSEEVLDVLEGLPYSPEVGLAQLYVRGDVGEDSVGYEVWHKTLLEADGMLALRVHPYWDDVYLRLTGPHTWQAIKEIEKGVGATTYGIQPFEVLVLLNEFEVSLGMMENAPFP